MESPVVPLQLLAGDSRGVLERFHDHWQVVVGDALDTPAHLDGYRKGMVRTTLWLRGDEAEALRELVACRERRAGAAHGGRLLFSACAVQPVFLGNRRPLRPRHDGQEHGAIALVLVRRDEINPIRDVSIHETRQGRRGA
jgi:hypothetical protein